MTLRAVFPGSFDPLTVAHVTMARAARDRVRDDLGIEMEVDLAMSVDPLGKHGAMQHPIEARRRAIEAATDRLPWLGVVVCTERLIVDIASTYDRVVVGADKWSQLFDPAFAPDRPPDEMVAALCPAIVFARPGHRIDQLRPVDVILELPAELRHVSSTHVRDGRDEWRYPQR